MIKACIFIFFPAIVLEIAVADSMPPKDPLPPVVFNVEKSCNEVKSKKKEGMSLIKRIRGQKCVTNLFCSNIGFSNSKRLKVSINHWCNLDGIFHVSKASDKEDVVNSYFDFENSLHSIKEKDETARLFFNTVMVNGYKVYTTSFGYNEDNKLFARVTKSKEYHRVDNRDPHNSEVIYDRTGGFFEFIQNEGSADLVFYKETKCSRSTLNFEFIKGCFIAEKVSYPGP